MMAAAAPTELIESVQQNAVRMQMQLRLGRSSPLSSTSRDADQDSPLAILAGAVADDLCAHHVGRAIKDLGRAAVTLQA